MKDKGMIVSMRDTQKTKQAMDNIVKQYRKAPLKKNTAFAARRKKSMMGLALTPQSKMYDFLSK